MALTLFGAGEAGLFNHHAKVTLKGHTFAMAWTAFLCACQTLPEDNTNVVDTRFKSTSTIYMNEMIRQTYSKIYAKKLLIYYQQIQKQNNFTLFNAQQTALKSHVIDI